MRISGTSETGDLISSALEVMTAVSNRAEDDYQRSLSALRERDDAASALAATYDALDEERYLERWSVVQLLTDLRTPSVIGPLTEVVRQPIPPERSADPAHGFSTVGEEVLIRTTAIEALARLLQDGNQGAGDLLLELLRHDVLSVRRAAVQAIASAGDRQLNATVREILEGTGDEWMLTVRRIDVAEAPQADARQFIRKRDAQGASTPPDPSDS